MIIDCTHYQQESSVKKRNNHAIFSVPIMSAKLWAEGINRSITIDFTSGFVKGYFDLACLMLLLLLYL